MGAEQESPPSARGFVANPWRGEACAWLPEASLVRRAERFVEEQAHRGLREVTLLRAPCFDTPGLRVTLALECFQVTGSFKVRGALFALLALGAQPDLPPRVVAASAGNHGAGVAFAARALGIAATLVVPRGAPAAKLEKMREFGADVRLAASDHYDGAEAEALALAAEQGLPFLSPYDDPAVLVGNGATLAFEIVRKLGAAPAAVIAPFGGGGLATGLALGLAQATRTRSGSARDVPVYGAQSEASCAFALSLARGNAVTTLEGPETLAEGLEGGISERGFARARATSAGVFVVDEPAIASAMHALYRELGLVVEGSAAVGLAALRARASAPALDGDVVIVLTGRNVDPTRVQHVML